MIRVCVRAFGRILSALRLMATCLYHNELDHVFCLVLNIQFYHRYGDSELLAEYFLHCAWWPHVNIIINFIMYLSCVVYSILSKIWRFRERRSRLWEWDGRTRCVSQGRVCRAASRRHHVVSETSRTRIFSTSYHFSCLNHISLLIYTASLSMYHVLSETSRTRMFSIWYHFYAYNCIFTTDRCGEPESVTWTFHHTGTQGLHLHAISWAGSHGCLICSNRIGKICWCNRR